MSTGTRSSGWSSCSLLLGFASWAPAVLGGEPASAPMPATLGTATVIDGVGAGGEGYLLWLAASMADVDPFAQEEFDRVWARCRSARSDCTGIAYVPAALALAEARWGNAGRFDYAAEAQAFRTGTPPRKLGVDERIFASNFEFIPEAVLTLALAGAGGGSVASAPGGIACGVDCEQSYPVGTEVVLTATAASAPLSNLSTFLGWSGGGCSGTGTCAVTLGQATTVTATFALQPNIAFVTSTSSHTGNLGGVNGADSICQARAQAAGLSGTYRAWLSTLTVNAIDRLTGASGWVRADGQPLVNSLADLANQRLFTPLRITETNVDVGVGTAHTATNVNGTRHGAGTTCNDYTAATVGNTLIGGATEAQGGLWTVSTFANCATPARLYCFGVDRAATVAPTPPPGGYRRAFVSSASFVPGGGIAAADALCNGEASSAGLPGTYRALLATVTVSAASRFDAGAGTLPWGRPDGQLCAATAAEFFSAPLLDSAPNTTAALDSHVGNFGNWGGAATVNAAGDNSLTCTNWTSGGSGGSGGRAGSTSQSRRFAGDINGCAATFVRVTCLQQ
jgi:hypothetical protein